MAADTDVLRHADAVFAAWIERLTQLFVAGGLAPATSADLATGLIAATEGAVAISRAQRNLRPFEIVAKQLMDQVRALS
jgi:hypothetical protein